MENNKSSAFGNIKALGIELGIILVLTVIIVAALNYLKIIDMGALFSKDSFTPVSNIAPIISRTPVQGNVSKPQGKNVAQQNLNYLAKNKSLHFAFSMIEYEGKIAELSTTPSVDKVSKLAYNIRIVLNIGTQSAKTVMVYPKEAMSKIKVLNTDKKALTLNDLKVGDSITIKTNVGILRQYPDNFNEVVITKK